MVTTHYAFVFCLWQARCGDRGGQKEESASFLKKRSKKLLFTWVTGFETSAVQMNQKFFARFFSKKRCFLQLSSLT